VNQATGELDEARQDDRAEVEADDGGGDTDDVDGDTDEGGANTAMILHGGAPCSCPRQRPRLLLPVAVTMPPLLCPSTVRVGKSRSPVNCMDYGIFLKNINASVRHLKIVCIGPYSDSSIQPILDDLT
jgi:hypothetical protein